MDSSENRLLDHLLQFRQCILRCLLIIFITFVSLIYFANPLYQMLAMPLMQHLPHDSHMIATGVIAPFFVPLKFTFIFSLFVAMPLILLQVFTFIAPGLYQMERSFSLILLLVTSFLFYLGVAFAYFIVCPMLFNFIASSTPEGVRFMPDMGQFLDFTLRFLFAFGIAFEVPALIVLVVKSGLVSLTTLKSKRPYIIVLAFIVGMFLTPPDVVSQLMLAVPICLLYELGLLVGKFILNK